MKITEAMIWWNDQSEHKGFGHWPMVKVLPRLGEDLEPYWYLGNSTGACCGGWASADPQKLATMLLALFNLLVARDGVPIDEASSEFLRIEEYRSWVEGGDETGPFAAAYRAWSEAENADAIS